MMISKISLFYKVKLTVKEDKTFTSFAYFAVSWTECC